MIDVNAEALKQAMENVARARFQAELREAIIFGPRILKDLLGEYEKLTNGEVPPKEDYLMEYLRALEKNKNPAPQGVDSGS